MYYVVENNKIKTYKYIMTQSLILHWTPTLPKKMPSN